MRQRRSLARAMVRIRMPTAALRKHPDFLVLGAQRAGTSSLFKYLTQHPDVARTLRKEVGFFSMFWDEGEAWYRSHFPLKADSRLCFDATPDYLLDPRAPDRVRAVLGHPKLVVLLRDPAKRAWSHFQHMRRLEQENLPFLDAMRAEPERLATYTLQRQEYWRHSYLARGRYAEQLERWMHVHPRENLHIEFAEDFFAQPGFILQRIQAFVGLRAWEPAEFANWSYSKQRPKGALEMPREVYDQVAAVFEADDARLEALLDRPVPWRTRR